ncbi:DUF1496 domain-containing protein [Vibrio sp. CAU 1672]|uniref:DUF1496 domain-containing protein n=1 Tax=Vibrio sp. CAU 1672 TaxID=3032594 RepID=UPI0023DB2F7B|nr:DUF1496 domain-containing protein [Vibrio sp. CAU 1672]MDF2155151.1 DUF1496 domain-containing protein [Vibrio sp. CAU 1672]
MKFLPGIRSVAGLLLMTLMTNVAIAKSYTTPEAKALVVADGKVGQRVCYYNDKAYSVGAVLKVENVLLQCTAANTFETNGALKWVVYQPEPVQRAE